MPRLFFIVVAFFLSSSLFAAAEADTEALNMALRVEAELTGVVEKTSSAFAFVGGGSGIVISADGYILSNHHVAGDRKQWTVRVFGKGKYYVCDLVGTDPVGDLCLLKARGATDLPFVEFGDISTLQVGQQCLTIGDPFKLADPWEGPPSVSLGTISALHRFQQNYCDAIQTDAAINPGNSGGPLVTLDGKLIGITGQIMSRFGAKANTGIGYSIPIDQVARFVPLLKAARGKFVYHGTLPEGVVFTPSSVDDMQAAVVKSVEPGSAGELLGFKKDDSVVSVNDKEVLNYWRLIGIIQSYPESQPVKVKVLRAGKDVEIDFKLPRMPLPPPPVFIDILGVQVVPSRSGDGLVVKAVAQDSVAERIGILKDDVILKVNGIPSTGSWQESLLAKRPREQVPIEIRRNTPTGNIQRTLTMVIERP